MAIVFNESQRIFYLHTKSTSYIFGFLNNNLVHIYWGEKLLEIPDVKVCVPYCKRPQSAYNDPENIDIQPDNLPLEFPLYGNTDLRGPMFHAMYEDGSTISDFKYVSHKILSGKSKLSGLPATYGDENEVQTLEIEFFDEKTNVKAILSYSVFYNKNAITRHARYLNCSDKNVVIQKALSANVDFFGNEFEIVSLCGSVLREREIQRLPVPFGETVFDSKRGASGHQRNPFIALVDKNTTEDTGRVYGFSLVYSGNFVMGAEKDSHGTIRVSLGINPFDFSWKLEEGEEFVTPEAVLVYSGDGIGGMSRIYHRLYRENLCRGKYKKIPRPIVLNTWETMHFDFDEDKLIKLAQNGKELGAELLVLDDGWFGKRDDDTSSLGDWTPHPGKLPDGLSGLAEKIKAVGLKFGLWVEPEMISENSKLYSDHPDWCIHVPGRPRSRGRHQLILDYSNREICDYIISVISDILENADISYIKWDMNRNMTEAGSAFLPPDRQRETAHRYMLGLYYVLETLTSKFPDVLFEGCAAGGGRFDGGILHYCPQIWTSDNSDAHDRLEIQYGTSIVYPSCTMAAHVSKSLNVNTRRITPVKTRCDVAMMGQFGLELDIGTTPDDELACISESIKKYKEIRDIIHNGDMYRIKSPFDSNLAVWQFISQDKNKVIVFAVNKLFKINGPFINIRLCDLDGDCIYTDKERGLTYSGNALMNLGLYLKDNSDFESRVFLFEKETKKQ